MVLFSGMCNSIDGYLYLSTFLHIQPKVYCALADVFYVGIGDPENVRENLSDHPDHDMEVEGAELVCQ